MKVPMRALLSPLQTGRWAGRTVPGPGESRRPGRTPGLRQAHRRWLLDPIEKKPLRRFHPGQPRALGGQLRLQSVLPVLPELRDRRGRRGALRPATARRRLWRRWLFSFVPAGNIGVAYTYNEPLVCYEYVRDCAAPVRAAGHGKRSGHKRHH